MIARIAGAAAALALAASCAPYASAPEAASAAAPETANAPTSGRQCFFLSQVSGYTHVKGSRDRIRVSTGPRDTYEFEDGLKVSDPAFRRSAEALGSPMVGGNTATLLENGDEIFPAMVRDILQAKKSVNLETYIFKPDRAGRMRPHSPGPRDGTGRQ